MILIYYRENGASGGCRCHGPDHYWNSKFQTLDGIPEKDVLQFATAFVADTDPEGDQSSSDFQFVYIRQASPKEIEDYEITFDGPKMGSVEGVVTNGIVRFEFSGEAIIHRIQERRDAFRKAKAEQEEGLKKAAKEAAARKAEAEERATYQRLQQKFGGSTS